MLARKIPHARRAVLRIERGVVLDELHRFVTEVVAVQLKVWVLVRREEGEEGVAWPAADFDDGLGAGLEGGERSVESGAEGDECIIEHGSLARGDIASGRGKSRLTSGLTASARSSNSVRSHARSLKKPSECTGVSA